MDGERFDQLTRALAPSTSRRRVLTGLLGAAATGLGFGQAAARGACPRDTPIRCGDECADLRTNPEHCGRCGRECAAGEVCYAGRCMTSCPNGFSACGGTCLRSCGSGAVRLENCACCTRTICGSQDCGEILDGCGGTVNCGDCTSPDTCGGGGTPNICGCTPATCGAEDCGAVDDGCGDTLDCGTCCEPTTCAAAGAECGMIDDGCGDPLDCGNCSGSQSCGAGQFANQCISGCAATLSTAGCTLNVSQDVWACPENVPLSGANLAGCDLEAADLFRANLSGVDLSGATLDRAGLEEANLSNADLSNATFEFADLRNATFHNANLTNVDWFFAVCPDSFQIGDDTCCDHLLDGDVPSAGCP